MCPGVTEYSPSRIERLSGLLVFGFFLFVGAYFFQGGGWNQNSHFDTVRAIVETGTFDITPYADNTGDVLSVDGRMFSNKPIGLALMGAPVYFLAVRMEQAFGIPPLDQRVINYNAHLVTFFVIGIPYALLAATVFFFFCNGPLPLSAAITLATAFGLGTLHLPFSGALINHNFVAMSLFVAWIAMDLTNRKPLNFLLAGLLLGLAMLTEYLAIPLTVFFVACAGWKNRGTRHWFPLLAGPILAGVLFVLLNHAMLGESWRIVFGGVAPEFREKGLLLGVFNWPDLRRLYWLSFHPYRGLLYCCPVFIVSIAGGIGSIVAKDAPRPGWFPLAVFSYFLLFNLTFNGWTGGWGIGPRYLIPGLPFLFCYTGTACKKFPLASALLMGISIGYMISVTAVTAMLPAANFGDPLNFDPTMTAFRHFINGELSINPQSILEKYPHLSTPGGLGDRWDSYNLGEIMGLRGLTSLLPLIALAVCYGLAQRWLVIRHRALSATPGS